MTQATKTLAAACKAQDWALAARHIAYGGPNDSRDFKDTFKPHVKEELDEIVDVCGAFDEMELARSLKVKSYETETESEGTWHKRRTGRLATSPRADLRAHWLLLWTNHFCLHH